MENTDSAVIQLTHDAGDHSFVRNGSVATMRREIRIDGKFFTRSGRRWRVQGVSYGPFAPSLAREHYPSPGTVATDFARMQAAQINTIRTYDIPPEWLLHQAENHGLAVLIDVPWRKHLCFLESVQAQREARLLVRQAAERGSPHSCVLAYNIGNEIPANIVRWHGRRRVQRFLAELADEIRQSNANSLITYANFPPTEYLDLPFLDFATFNVYLHDLETFRRYLLRLQNLVGDKPLLLGELGMDTLRHGELAQAHFLAGHVREAALVGLAGSFVFSWTDDWFTGGHAIHNWAFGVTHADRLPKASFHALRETFSSSPAQLLRETPRVSVVVCSYNGGRTLDQCLRSLQALDYPDYEVIVVNDGSTDDTQAILGRYQEIRAIHQSNQGLSAARNVGLKVATGSIIAYIDSDCYADPDWLTMLVHQLQCSTAAGVGGPNLSPDDGRLAACVAAAPGQPMHVLESDQVAEHIPGCNMAFRKQALLTVNGFDPAYRRAGDDVDLCWRLQQAGYWITFAPGAFVWHHRRQNPSTYLRQQAGYGEAEALLRFKHPDRFTGRGDGKWRGVVYGPSSQSWCFSEAIIYRGTFGAGLFQCIYQPAPAHWAMAPTSLEWHLITLALALAGILWPWAWIGVGVMLMLSLGMAFLQGKQARLAPEHDGFWARLMVSGLCYAQPLVRSWTRYCTRLFAYRPPVVDTMVEKGRPQALPLTGERTVVYWNEVGCNRLQLLGCVVQYLNEHRWGKTLDSGWSEWDLEIYCHPWTVVQVCTAQEDHGHDKALIRVRYQLRPSGYLVALCAVAAGVSFLGAVFLSWIAGTVALGLLTLAFGLWFRGTSRARLAVALFDGWATDLGMIRCDAGADQVAGKSGWLPARLARRIGRLTRYFIPKRVPTSPCFPPQQSKSTPLDAAANNLS